MRFPQLCGSSICCLLLLAGALGLSPLSASTVITGANPIADGGSVDGWSGLVVLTTPIEAPAGGPPEGKITTFNYIAAAARAGGLSASEHRVRPLLLKNSGGNYTVIGVGTERTPGSSGLFSDPFGLAAGTDTFDTSEANATFHAGFLQQRDGGNNSNAGVVPFNNGTGTGMFQMDTTGPDHVPEVDDVVTSGHASGPGGRDYQFNLVAEFEADPLPPTDITLTASELFPGIPQGTTVGAFETADPNASDDHTYELVTNPGNIFSISGASLQTAGTLGNQGTQYTIRVRSTDPEDLSIEEEFTLAVAAPSPPTDLAFGASSVNAGSVPGSAIGQFSVTDANSGDIHSYTLVPGAGDTHNDLFTVDGNWLQLAQALPAGLEGVSFRVRATDLSGLSVESPFALTVSDPSLRLNEYLASNGGFGQDEDGARSDWIEIANGLAATANLNGWYLSDDSDNLTKWQFPDTSVPANGYLVVYASGKDRSDAAGELHTNFQLSSSGEYLALVKPDGVTVASQFLKKPQYQDISYGVGSGGNEEGYLSPPTPGAANGDIYAFGENTVTFSHPRGFYDAELSLTLTATAPGSTIRYTTDGSEPTATHGSVYSAPIAVAPDTSSATRGTRRIRAFAVNPSAPPGPVVTHTYLFVNGVDGPGTDGIVTQNALRSEIRNHATYGPLMDDAFLALPAISIIGGTPRRGERQTSIEFFTPDGSEPGFQIDCGIQVVGGHSTGSPKNNFRLYFRSQYGEPNLKYPLFADHPFGPAATGVFDRLNLRSGSHDNFFWLGNRGNPPAGSRRGDACMLRNRWICDMQFLMGQESLRGRFVQVFVDGRYHGQYQIMEWPNHDYLASYLGGEDTDYHYTNGASASKSGSDHGGGDTWAQNWAQIENAAAGSWEQAQRYIDVENLADYMLLSFYAGNTWDWNPNQNWMAGGPKTPGAGGWKFFSWDCDIILQGVDHNNLSKNVPDGLFSRMMSRQPDFEVLFRDRVYKHCFNGGTLTPGVPQAVMNHWEREIRNSIVAETARWQPGSPASAPWDRDGEWQAELSHYRQTWFPRRTDILLQQLRSRGWYPVDAPEFAQRGGPVPAGYRPQFSASPGDKIYVTTDGSDPRLPGGGINPDAILVTGDAATQTITAIDRQSGWRYLDDGSNQGTAWRTPGFDDASWAEDQAELGYGDNNENSVISYGPDIANKYITTYFRKTFEVDDTSAITEIAMDLLRDDGAVVYINGIEVWRDNLPQAGTIDYLTLASSSIRGGDESVFISKLDIPTSVLVDGTNVIAVEIHQAGRGDSDVSFDLELRLTGLVDPGSSLVRINDATLVRARALDGSEWSAINEASFVLVGTSPADDQNLAISEIHYNPDGSDDTEFVEFRNQTADPVELSGVEVSGAVEFTFPLGTVLAGNSSLVIVEDLEAFQTRYTEPASPWFFPGIQLAGQWSGGLSNGGEAIAVHAENGTGIMAFEYNDSGAWPGRADGNGSSTELRDPVSLPAGDARNAYLGDGSNWRPSSEYHGSPGRDGSGADNRIVINEVLAHSDPPQTDTIELHNPGSTPIGLGGWFLSDSANNFRKFSLPAGTTIQPGGFLVLDESAINSGGAGNPVPFALSSSQGDNVYLVEADAGGNLLRFVDRVEFAASAAGEAFGRWPDATGDLYPMQQQTFGALNRSSGNAVRTGSVVVSEIMYNPSGTDSGLEFIEIINTGAQAEPLANWRLRGEADFDFADEDLPSSEILVLVGFDPVSGATLRDAFLATYPTASAAQLRGPWSAGSSNQLDNGGGAIRLQRPDGLVSPAGETPFYPMLIEDTVNYDDDAPWPTTPDAGGVSLIRSSSTVYGDDPANWQAAADPTANPGIHDAAPPSVTYEAWAAFHGLGDGPEAQPDGDFDLDGVLNLIEFGGRGDPTAADPQPVGPLTDIREIEVGGITSPYVTMTYRRRNDAPHLVYTVEASDDLISWETISETVGQPVDNGDETTSVTVRDGAPASQSERRFIRLTVQEP